MGSDVLLCSFENRLIIVQIDLNIRRSERCGLLRENLLAVHANYLARGDATLLGRRKAHPGGGGAGRGRGEVVGTLSMTGEAMVVMVNLTVTAWILQRRDREGASWP